VIHARQLLDLQSGLLVTVPVPAGAALDEDEMEAFIAQAAAEADARGIHGAAATPWLLNRVRELTDGRSLEANVALLRNNATIAAQIAAELCEIKE
jgi:pseudouridine-5'-phosphate glycosidase